MSRGELSRVEQSFCERSLDVERSVDPAGFSWTRENTIGSAGVGGSRNTNNNNSINDDDNHEDNHEDDDDDEAASEVVGTEESSVGRQVGGSDVGKSICAGRVVCRFIVRRGLMLTARS